MEEAVQMWSKSGPRERQKELCVCVARWDRKGAIIGGSRMIARSRACDKHGEGKRIANKYKTCMNINSRNTSV